MDYNFIRIQAFTKDAEGGLSVNKNDKGGITNHGISLRFLTKFACEKENKPLLASIGIHTPITEQTIRLLSKQDAQKILLHEFWEKPKIGSLPFLIAAPLYDFAVNSGAGVAIMALQRALRSMAQGRQHSHKNLVVDGKLGPKTRAAVHAFLGRPLYNALASQRLGHFERIIQKDVSQRVFLDGWKNRLHNLQVFMREQIEWTLDYGEPK